MDFVIHHSYLIPLLPLLGAVAAGSFGARHLRGNSHWPIWLGVGGSAVLSFVLLFGMLARWHPHDAAHENGTSGSPSTQPAEHAAAPVPEARLAAMQDDAEEADDAAAAVE